MAQTPVDGSAQGIPAEPSESTSDSLVGVTLSERYEIVRKVGQGGMGVVYQATQLALKKPVAIKVLLEKYARENQIVARLEQEARLASSIGHQNIVDMSDVGQTSDGRTFIVMEFLEGESLSGLFQREGKISCERACKIGLQVASALGAAHKKGIVHRDLKPENIFLVPREQGDFVKVLDFGVSKLMRTDDPEMQKLTQTGMVLGTPLYMSPEQARGDEYIDHRIDIYALGVMLYEALTGDVPFRGTNYLNVLSQVVSATPKKPREKNPLISADLQAVILRTLEKSPADRYQTMEELAADLSLILGNESGLRTTSARILAARQRRPAKSPRKAALRATLIGAVVATTAGAGYVFVRSDKAAPATPIPGKLQPSPVLAAQPLADAGVAKPSVVEATVKIISEPPNATVYLGDRVIGQTPFDYRLEKKNQPISLVAELRGFDDGKLEINPYFDDGKSAQVRLMKAVKVEKKLPKKPQSVSPGIKSQDDTAGGDLTGNPHRHTP